MMSSACTKYGHMGPAALVCAPRLSASSIRNVNKTVLGTSAKNKTIKSQTVYELKLSTVQIITVAPHFKNSLNSLKL